MIPEGRQRRYVVILVVSCVLGPFFFLSSSLSPWRGQNPSALMQDLFFPLEYAWDSSVTWVGSSWKHYVDLSDAAHENTRLKKEILMLRTKILDYQERVQETSRLRSLLGFTRRHQSTQLVGEIIGRPRLSPFHSIRVSLGKPNGVRVGMPVVTSEGVVGRIIRVGWLHSDVQLLTDPNFNLDVLLQRTRVRGIIAGLGSNRCLLKLHRRAEIRIDDTIVTSGIVGGFPKGLPIGRVVRISYESNNIAQKVAIEPWVDFRRLEEVVVLRTEDKEIKKIIETAGEEWLEKTVNRSAGG